MELYPGLVVGERLRIFHGYCLVIHPATQIGRNVTLRHGITLGSREGSSIGAGAPTLDDGVDIGANAIVIGPVRVGRNAIVGAGAVVTKDVSEGAVVVGNPARVIRIRSANESL